MAAITNSAGEGLEISFGGLGMVVTFTSKGARPSAAPLSGASWPASWPR